MKDHLKEFNDTVSEYRKLWAAVQDKNTIYRCETPNRSLRDCLEEWARITPEHPFVITSDRVYSFDECNRQANMLANGLLGSGCLKGDRVIAFMPNGFELILVSLACFKIGAVLVVSNSRDTFWEYIRTINDCRPRFAVCDQDSLTVLVEARRNAPTEWPIERVLFFGQLAVDETCLSAESVFDCRLLVEDGDDSNPLVEVYPDDLQLLQYTGGTDGVPKACCFTNRNLLAAVTCSVNYFRPVIPPEELAILIGIPMFHVYGMLLGVIVHLLAGSRVILPDNAQSEPEELLASIEKFKPTLWPAVPVVIDRVVRNPELLKLYDISSLRMILSGSSPISLDVQTAFESLSGIHLSDAYGLSEALASGTGNPTELRKLGTIGIPFCNTDVLTVDEAGTKVVGLNEVGEIIIRGPHVMQGYWEKPEKTAEVLRDGWLYTGDLGVIDEEGYVSIVGRKKDLIIVSGQNVYPIELEQVLREHADIEDACAIAVPDEARGEVPKVFVVRRAGSNLTEEDVRDFCRTKLARYKIPRCVEFIEEIPRTKLKKPDKKALRQREKMGGGLSV